MGSRHSGRESRSVDVGPDARFGRAAKSDESRAAATLFSFATSSSGTQSRSASQPQPCAAGTRTPLLAISAGTYSRRDAVLHQELAPAAGVGAAAGSGSRARRRRRAPEDVVDGKIEAQRRQAEHAVSEPTFQRGYPQRGEAARADHHALGIPSSRGVDDIREARRIRYFGSAGRAPLASAASASSRRHRLEDQRLALSMARRRSGHAGSTGNRRHRLEVAKTETTWRQPLGNTRRRGGRGGVQDPPGPPPRGREILSAPSEGETRSRCAAR